MKPQISVGIKIKRLRQKLGFSQTELGKMVRLSARHIYNIEKGERAPAPLKIAELAKALGVTVTFLIDEETEKAGEREKREHVSDLFLTLSESDQERVIIIMVALAEAEKLRAVVEARAERLREHEARLNNYE